MARTNAFVVGVIDGMETTKVKRLAGRAFVDVNHSVQECGMINHSEARNIPYRVFDIVDEGSLSMVGLHQITTSCRGPRVSDTSRPRG
jgi:hypothetical protein